MLSNLLWLQSFSSFLLSFLPSLRRLLLTLPLLPNRAILLLQHHKHYNRNHNPLNSTSRYLDLETHCQTLLPREQKGKICYPASFSIWIYRIYCWLFLPDLHFLPVFLFMCYCVLVSHNLCIFADICSPSLSCLFLFFHCLSFSSIACIVVSFPFPGIFTSCCIF